VIGKDCKNLSEGDDPQDYVLGYTVGNDISSRYWQQPERSGHQHGYAKSFDKFAPLGPVICSRNIIPDPSTLSLKTSVNGALRQEGKTNDLIFDVSSLIRFFSRGMTLRKGTVIMTGTPAGVGITRSPPALLMDGDVVEVEISGIGRIKNRMVFET
jgi:2-keto-4-pentenoate hydratase/2-oxohepta-3-ene-1,7-dioic acid hydratase in catechol pathway